jgi:hypothetical protein
MPEYIKWNVEKGGASQQEAPSGWASRLPSLTHLKAYPLLHNYLHVDNAEYPLPRSIY